MFKDYLEKKGLSKNDIPAGIIYFKITSYATWFCTLALCYKYRPLKNLFKINYFKQKLNYVKSKYPKVCDNYNNLIINKSKKLAEWKYFKPIPESLGLKSLHVVEALSENFVLYKLLLPVLLPIQFWIILKLLKHNKNE